MINNKTKPIVAALLLLAIAQPASADHGNFHCDRIPFLNERAVKAIDELSHNKTMSVIVKQYAEQWEDAEILRTCEAAAAGEPADFSCMQGRRDWDAIKSLIPQELFAMDAEGLRTHQLANQKQRAQERPRATVLEQCEALGVLER